MKKLLYACIAAAFLVSCSVDNTELTEQEQDLTQSITEANLNRGTYYGMFTTLDSKYRAKVEINIPKINGPELQLATNVPFAKLTLQNGSVIIARGLMLPESKTTISNLLFEGDGLSFIFSVENDGRNPTISNASYKSLDADIVLIKSSKAPQTITGTYECLDCGTHPALGKGEQQTFNIMFPSGGTGNENDITTQLVLGGNIFNSNSGNSQSNCTSNDGKNNCEINGTSVNGNVTWTGNHIYQDNDSCNSVTGTWDFDSNYGQLTGTFIADAPVCKQTLFDEDFNTFDGSGFAPNPVAGQLDSNIYKITGLSDGSSEYGDSNTTGDFARGADTGGVGTGGIYAFATSTGDFSLGVQPGGKDFTPGTIEIRVENQSVSHLKEVYLTADLYINNDQNRSNSIDISYSTDGVNFTTLTPGTDYTTPELADNNGFQLAFNVTKTIDLSADPLEPMEFIYFRLESDDVSGSGSRDEFSIDNILVEGI